MKRILMLAISLLVLIALVVPGCGGTTPPEEYDLTMEVSPEGAGTTTPTGTTSHEADASISLTATPSEGWQFVNWTALAGSFADENAASTTFTMPAEAVTVTANFEEIPTISFAVAGPMTFIQGKDHWQGALMARDAINDAGGVDVGGVAHMIELTEVETNEILDVTGVDGRNALLAVIDEVDFVVGGFRTESLTVYREVVVGPEGVGKIFMNCGAATTSLQASVVSDYDDYKYWFKATPYNEVFLVTSVLKYTGLVHLQLRAALGDPGYPLDVAILMEDADWCNPMQPYAEGGLALMGMNHVVTVKCSSYADDLETELGVIAGYDPHVVFTILSGPPGKAYGYQQGTYLPNVFSLGINVEAQDISYYADTGAEYHMTLDTWAELVEPTPYALDFFNAFVAATDPSRYPTYCAATYDAIHSIVEAVETVSAANAWDDIADVIDHANIDALIGSLEESQRVGVGARTGYFPMPGGLLGGTTPYLTFAQVSPLYPHLVEADPGPGEWLYDETKWTVAGGHIAHDTLYGPDWQTAIAIQWQPVDLPEGDWWKVAVWPMYMGEVGDLLLDQYGDWNFAYPGTQTLMIDPDWITYHGS